MELLAANDQENAVRHLQPGPNGKALGGSIKGQHNPKTPFKVPLNDENGTVFRGGKTLLQTGKKEQNAFVTPAGPRNRAPLGMKTTNAKAKAFQTPAPLTGSVKTQKLSPRLRRPKIKVHEPEVHHEEEDDVAEIEYMPPKEVPLPDVLDDDLPPINWEFPQFKGAAMTHGYHSVYHNPVEDDGRTKGERELEESLKRDQKKAFDAFEKQFEEIMAKEEAEAKRNLGIDDDEEPAKKAAPSAALPKKTTTRSAPSTLSSRSAAAALSTLSQPRYAAPTAAAKSKVPGSTLTIKKPLPTTSRNALGVAASRSTIGYAQGRATSTGTTITAATSQRKPLSNVTRPPPPTFMSSSASTSSISKRPTVSSIRPTTLSRPTTASSLRSRPASSASTRSVPASAASTTHRPISARPRAPVSRSSSTSTNATLVASVPAQQENYRTAEDVEREMQRLCLLQEDDDDDEDALEWEESSRRELEGGVQGVDELYEDFQFTLPEGL